MADTTTTNLGLTKPGVADPGGINVWGGKTNTNWDAVDAVFAGAGSGTSVGLNVGSGKTLTVAGTLAVSAGGIVSNQRHAVADANYTVVAADSLVAFTSITAARTITLPAASSRPAGSRLVIVDESNGASATNQISLAPNGTDKIANSNTTQVVINIPLGSIEFVCNGSNGWYVVGAWPVIYQASLGSPVSTTTTYADVLSVSQGSVGTWEVTATALYADTTDATGFAKLYDGTTVVTSGAGRTLGSQGGTITLSGVINAPAGNLRIAARGFNTATGSITVNATAAGANTVLRAKRIG